MLAFSDEGSGPSLVFLPGITCSREHWRPVVDLLVGDHRCVMIDPPGHGESPPGSMNVVDQAGAIREVLDAAGVERPGLVGHSAGGVAATIYAAIHPCAGLVNVEGNLQFVHGLAEAILGAKALLTDPDRFAEGFAQVIAPMRIDLVPDERRAWVQGLIGATPEVVLDAWRDLLAGNGAQLNEQISAVLPTIEAPTLVVWGDEPQEGEADMVALMTHGALEVWAGLGHFLHLVDPQRTADRIRAFAASLPEATIAG